MPSASEQLVANFNFETFIKAKDLHRRIGFTVAALVVYRLGAFIPIPGIDVAAFSDAFQGQSKGLLGMFNVFSGGAVERMAIFSLNVMPYISASIIVQLLGAVYPPWERMRKKDGEAGRKQLNQYTRYLTVVLSLFQAFGIALGLQSTPGMVSQPGLFFVASTVATLTGGSVFLMWIGEQITSRGIGNGISLLILSGIVAALPQGVMQMASLIRTGAIPLFAAFAMGVGVAGFVAVIVFVECSQRRLRVQYPGRGGWMAHRGNDSAFLPLKVNTSGVIPPIFASSLLLLPATVLGLLGSALQDQQPGWLSTAVGQLQHGRPLFMTLYGAMIVFFTFFYTSIVFNSEETADNLRKHGGFLPGVRPGRQTAQRLDFVLSRLTVIGAAYITGVCLLPEILIGAYSIPFYLGGTSLLIVVVVAIDLVNQVQSHLVAHQYGTMIARSRLRTSEAAGGAR